MSQIFNMGRRVNMADDISEPILKPLVTPLSGKFIPFFSFTEFFIALLMSFFIMRETHFNPLWIFKRAITLQKNPITSTQHHYLAYRSLNHLTDISDKIHPALLSLCQLTNIQLRYNTHLEKIVQKTQYHWLRKPGTERHELTQSYHERQKKQFLSLLKHLNVIDKIHAKHTHKPYDSALIHGAMVDAMEKRIQFLIDEYQRGVRFKKVILLSSDRPLDASKEGEYIKQGLKTEAEAFQYLWQKMPGLPEEIKQSFSLINTKGKVVKKHYKRPTTRDTIHQWLDEMSPLLGSQCLAISHQPFVPFQDFVFYNILQKRFKNLYLETIGTSADSEEAIPVHLDNLARCLYELQYSKSIKTS